MLLEKYISLAHITRSHHSLHYALTSHCHSVMLLSLKRVGCARQGNGTGVVLTGIGVVLTGIEVRAVRDVTRHPGAAAGGRVSGGECGVEYVT